MKPVFVGFSGEPGSCRAAREWWCCARCSGVGHRRRCTGQFLCSIWRPFLRPDLAIALSRRAQAPSRSAVATGRSASSSVSRPHLDGGEHGGMLEASRGRSSAVLEAPALVAGLDNVAVVREPVQQRRRHLCVDEDARPFAEGQVGRDDDGGALIEPADQVEQQMPTRLRKRQVAKARR